VDITVEADNAEDALEKAKDELLDSKYDGEILNNVQRVDHDIMEG
jgi:flagellar biosynthesis regulator FlbT